MIAVLRLLCRVQIIAVNLATCVDDTTHLVMNSCKLDIYSNEVTILNPYCVYLVNPVCIDCD